MDGVDFTRTFRLFEKAKRSRKQDYRRKLEESSFAGGESDAEDVLTASPGFPYAERVHQLTRSIRCSSTVLQCVAVTSLQTLRQVLARQRAAASAAISLAHREKLRGMIGATEAMADALSGDVLSAQGSKLLGLSAAPEAPAVDTEASWWFALTETIEALDEGAERIASVVSGQPKGAPSRVLSSLVVRQLRAQRNELLAEADQWIS